MAPDDLQVDGTSYVSALVMAQYTGRKLDPYEARSLDDVSKNKSVARLVKFAAAFAVIFSSEVQFAPLMLNSNSLAGFWANSSGTPKYELLTRLVQDEPTSSILGGTNSAVFDAARQRLVEDARRYDVYLSSGVLLAGDHDMRLDNVLFASDKEGSMVPRVKLDSQHTLTEINFMLRFVPDFGPFAAELARDTLRECAADYSDFARLSRAINPDLINFWHRVQWTTSVIGAFCYPYSPQFERCIDYFGLAWPDLDADALREDYRRH
jgi:hypothetical protein